MRTTIEIPDALFRRTKSLAAARGLTLKQFIVTAVEREVEPVRAPPAGKKRRPLPLIHLEPGCTLDLTTFNFDDLLS
jgi:hypothetical protein